MFSLKQFGYLLLASECFIQLVIRLNCENYPFRNIEKKLTFISPKINSSLLSSQSISDGSRMRIEGLATFTCLVTKIFLPSDPKTDFCSQFGRAVSVKALTRSSPLLAGHAGNCRKFFFTVLRMLGFSEI